MIMYRNEFYTRAQIILLPVDTKENRVVAWELGNVETEYETKHRRKLAVRRND